MSCHACQPSNRVLPFVHAARFFGGHDLPPLDFDVSPDLKQELGT